MANIKNTEKPKDNIDVLLKQHGKRVKPNELVTKRAMKNVRAHWQANIDKQNQKKKQRHTLLFRIAASLLIMVSVYLVQINIQQSPAISTNNIYVNGEVHFSNDGINWGKIEQKSMPYSGWIKTNAESFATLTMLDNSQLRLNNKTTVHLLSASEIALDQGEIYHDADDANKTNPLTIITNMGNIQHIGTRYLVNKNSNELQVSVRNGLVAISSDNVKRQLQAGKQITIKSTGIQSETDISSYDSLWHWTQVAAQPFSTQGKTLNDFIIWYAHENGYKINWNESQTKTKRVKLTGDISQLSKSQQIKTIFLSTKFDYEINQGILSIL